MGMAATGVEKETLGAGEKSIGEAMGEMSEFGLGAKVLAAGFESDCVCGLGEIVESRPLKALLKLPSKKGLDDAPLELFKNGFEDALISLAKPALAKLAAANGEATGDAALVPWGPAPEASLPGAPPAGA